MELTRFTDIGLRVLMRLAADTEGRAPGAPGHTTRRLADELAVPYSHVAKVVARMSELGVLHSRRGRTGGLSITDLGRTASVGWVTRQLEGDSPVVECGGERPCPLRAACRLRGALARAQNAFYESLDTLTVADLIDDPTGATLLTLIPRDHLRADATTDRAHNERRSRA
ncbi:MAG: Rrf2 family transcriptional regulator [Gordonia sp. (in: high G+C Gram-positive bacteria)]